MTIEEAIEILKSIKEEFDCPYDIEALDMAIQALQTQLKESPENFNKPSETESMLNADLISRRAAIEEIRNLKISVAGKDIFPNEAKETIIKTLDELPSVQPEQNCHEDKVKVLGKIRTEIGNDWQLKDFPSSSFSCGLRRAIEIIDKYMAESEEA